MQNEGIKYDGEKARMALVLGGFANALIDVGKVGTFGAKKYNPNNWKSLENGKERCLDAALRHLFQYLAGEEMDEEMLLPHLAAATWELLAAQEFIYMDRKIKGGDSASCLNTQSKEPSRDTICN